jgi:hypothetical protein
MSGVFLQMHASLVAPFDFAFRVVVFGRIVEYVYKLSLDSNEQMWEWNLKVALVAICDLLFWSLSVLFAVLFTRLEE